MMMTDLLKQIPSGAILRASQNQLCSQHVSLSTTSTDSNNAKTKSCLLANLLVQRRLQSSGLRGCE
eukprot:10314587-Karenia_brevis.AAC.1